MSKIALVIIVIIIIVIALGAYLMISFKNQDTNIKILTKGSGQAAKSGDSVTVNYVGTLQDGTKFDSSYDRNAPFTFTLGKGMVIKGWEQGIVGMKIGEKRKLTISAELAYGTTGFPPVIPPDSTLIFEIELLKIN